MDVLVPTLSSPLASLPDHILDVILSALSEHDLAKLSCTGKAISQQVVQLPVWKILCIHRWPCQAESVYTTWRQAYGVRRQLPASLPRLIDSAHLVTERARLVHKNPGTLARHFSTFLTQLLGAGVVYAGWPEAAMQGRQDHQLLRSDVAWWLEEQPAVVISAVQAQLHSLHTLGDAALVEVACARSALEFIVRGGLAALGCAGLDRVNREVGLLDAGLRQALLQGSLQSDLVRSVKAHLPVSVPLSHWWWGKRSVAGRG